MKIAVLADIHGNFRALEAVLADLKSEAPDAIVNLGDCLSGPLWPQETAELLMAENWPTVRGNHDRELAEFPVDRLGDVDRLVHRNITVDVLAWLTSLPAVSSLGDDILLCHGSPASDEVFLLEEDGGDHFYPSSNDQIETKLGAHDTKLVLCGHTHTPRVVRLSSGTIILNPGSVGVQAFPGLTITGSPHSRYATAERRNGTWSCRHHVIEYDWRAAAKQAELLGFPNWSEALTTGFAPKTEA